MSIRLKIEGNAFNNGYDLHLTLDILKNFEEMLDKAYGVITNKKKITERDREIYKIKTIDIKHGSFIGDFEIYIATAIQLALPFVCQYKPNELWEMVKNGFELAKLLFTAESENKEVKIEQGEDGDTMFVHIQGNDNCTINVTRNTYIYASKALENYQRLAEKIDGLDTEQITLAEIAAHKIEPKIVIDKKTKEIFKNKSKVEEKAINIVGRIFKIDVDEKQGKIEIIDAENKEYIGQEFNFKTNNDFIAIDDLCGCINKPTKFNALKKVCRDPFTQEEKIECLILINIE